MQFKCSNVLREVIALWEPRYQRNVSQVTSVLLALLQRLQPVRLPKTANQVNISLLTSVKHASPVLFVTNGQTKNIQSKLTLKEALNVLLVSIVRKVALQLQLSLVPLELTILIQEVKVYRIAYNVTKTVQIILLVRLNVLFAVVDQQVIKTVRFANVKEHLEIGNFQQTLAPVRLVLKNLL